MFSHQIPNRFDDLGDALFVLEQRQSKSLERLPGGQRSIPVGLAECAMKVFRRVKEVQDLFALGEMLRDEA